MSFSSAGNYRGQTARHGEPQESQGIAWAPLIGADLSGNIPLHAAKSLAQAVSSTTRPRETVTLAPNLQFVPAP